MYKTEAELVAQFVELLATNPNPAWGYVETATEFPFTVGRTDVIALTEDGQLVAFEVKLRKWREALHQAYQAESFAHFGYIVVPKEVAERALKHEDEFRVRSVGICYVSEGQMVILRQADRWMPLQAGVMDRAVAHIARRSESGAKPRTCCASGMPAL